MRPNTASNIINGHCGCAALIRSDFEAAFDPEGKYRVDALLTPTTPTTAFPDRRCLRRFRVDAVCRPADRSGQPCWDPGDIHSPGDFLLKDCRLGSSSRQRITGRIFCSGLGMRMSWQQSMKPGGRSNPRCLS